MKPANKKRSCRWAVAMLLPLLTTQAQAYPIDPSQSPVMDIQLPNEVSGYVLAYDSANDVKNSDNVVYYQPKTGTVATVNEMPMVGLAFFTRNGVTRAFFNAQFGFNIPSGHRDLLLDAIKQAGYKPRPFPFKSTTVIPSIPGWDNATKQKLCVTSKDEFTGQEMVKCDSLVDQMKYTESGPTLGENIAVSAILSEQGAVAIKDLLRGGNAFNVDLKARYDAAAPAYTARIEVNYEKLSESFAMFAAYHNGACADIQISGFWENEIVCSKGRPDDCSVKVTYTDQNGRSVNNMYEDPHHPENIKTFYNAIEGLRVRFENEMLVKETPASVDKSVNAIYTLRTDYKRVSRNVHFVLERKSLGLTHEQETTIPASILCVQVGTDGAVSKSKAGDCGEFWAGRISADDYMFKLRSQN